MPQCRLYENETSHVKLSPCVGGRSDAMNRRFTAGGEFCGRCSGQKVVRWFGEQILCELQAANISFRSAAEHSSAKRKGEKKSVGHL